MFKYMSAHVAPRFAKTLQVRFTQPSDLNDPLNSARWLISSAVRRKITPKFMPRSTKCSAPLTMLWRCS